MCPLSVVVVGTSDELPYLMRSLDQTDECDLVGVVTQPDSSQAVTGTSRESGVEVHETESINTSASREFLAELEPDLGVCLGWYEVIDPAIFGLPAHGTLGIHAAPLPAGRGQAPVNWQLIGGRDEAMVSVFEFAESVDAGPIYGQRSVPILDGEDIGSLYDRLMYFAIDQLVTTVQEIAAGDATPREQSPSEATYWPARRPEDGLLDWHRSARQLERFVRALADPYPSAHTYADGKQLEIVEATVTDADSSRVPGEVLDVTPPKTLTVQTGNGALNLDRVAYDGSPRLTGGEFATEHGLEPGETLGAQSHFPADFTYTALRGPDARADLLPITNVTVGETVSNRAYCFRPGTEREIVVEASVDGDRILRETVSATGHTAVPIEFRPQRPGEHFLRVEFGTGDTRTTYVYASQ